MCSRRRRQVIPEPPVHCWGFHPSKVQEVPKEDVNGFGLVPRIVASNANGMQSSHSCRLSFVFTKKNSLPRKGKKLFASWLPACGDGRSACRQTGVTAGSCMVEVRTGSTQVLVPDSYRAARANSSNSGAGTFEKFPRPTALW